MQRQVLSIILILALFTSPVLYAETPELQEEPALAETLEAEPAPDDTSRYEEQPNTDERILEYINKLFWVTGDDLPEGAVRFSDGLGGRALLLDIESSWSRATEDLDNSFVILGKALDAPAVPVINVVITVRIKFKDVEKYLFVASVKSVVDYAIGDLTRKAFYKSHVYKDVKSVKE